FVYPDDLPGAEATGQRALKSFRPEEGEWRVIWPDGSVHWLVARFQAFPNAEGQPARLVGVNIDITDRKKVEEALGERERALQRQARMIDLAPAATLIRRLDGTITFWSEGAERLYGWTKKEAVGRRTNELLHTEFSEPLES